MNREQVMRETRQLLKKSGVDTSEMTDDEVTTEANAAVMAQIKEMIGWWESLLPNARLLAPPGEKMIQHPVQPLEEIDGVLRFKENKIVRFLLDRGPFDLNQLAMMKFSDEDREQFAQLIGYSVSGFEELDYVSDETYERAWAQKEEK